MLERHRRVSADQLDCPHALGTDTFSAEWSKSFRYLLLLPSPLLLISDENRRIFESALERVRRSYRLYVYGYVVMPEHVHLLVSEPQQGTLAEALKSLKQGTSRRLIRNLPLEPKAGLGGPPEHFWQKRYYDFNIRNYPQFVEKLRYIHRNPVKAGLCERPADWPWSSFLHYATGAEGRVEIESEWTARKRERAAGTQCRAGSTPTQAKNGLEWATRPQKHKVPPLHAFA